MAIKLVAIDIDGTLLNSQGELPEANRTAVAWARARDVKVILVTGRRWGLARRVAVGLDLPFPIVAHNGAMIKLPTTLQRFATQFIAPEAACRVLQQTRDYLQYTVLHRDAGDNGQTVIHPVCSQNRKMQSYLAQLPEAVLETSSLETLVDSELIQIMFGGELPAMLDLERLLADSGLLEHVRLTKTCYPTKNLGIIDLLDKECSKRTALELLARLYGVSREEVMAIGDNHNDLEMLEYAGLGVLVANCVAELKGRGFEEVDSNNDGGVAQALLRYLV